MRNKKTLWWTMTLGIAACLLLLTVEAQALARAGGSAPQLRCSESTPPSRGYASTVYDWKAGKAYLIGGFTTLGWTADLFDVWSYDSLTRRWKQVFQDASGSSFNAFQYDSVALDPESKQVVLYAIYVDCTDVDCGVETWIYDLRANTFENVTSGTEPPLRWGSRVAYDADSKRAILFGGSDAVTGNPLNDTWAFDFATRTWTSIDTAVTPPAHDFHDMVYDPRGRRIIMFGGPRFPPFGQPEEGYVLVGDTWAFDSQHDTWVDLQPRNPPPARHYHSLAFDWVSNRILMFGGVVSGPEADQSWPHEATLDETWAYSGKHNAWTQLSPRTSPSARAWQSMVGTWGGILMFGGGADRTAYTNDTWTYTPLGNRWRVTLPCTIED